MSKYGPFMSDLRTMDPAYHIVTTKPIIPLEYMKDSKWRARLRYTYKAHWRDSVDYWYPGYYRGTKRKITYWVSRGILKALGRPEALEFPLRNAKLAITDRQTPVIVHEEGSVLHMIIFNTWYNEGVTPLYQGEGIWKPTTYRRGQHILPGFVWGSGAIAITLNDIRYTIYPNGLLVSHIEEPRQ